MPRLFYFYQSGINFPKQTFANVEMKTQMVIRYPPIQCNPYQLCWSFFKIPPHCNNNRVCLMRCSQEERVRWGRFSLWPCNWSNIKSHYLMPQFPLCKWNWGSLYHLRGMMAMRLNSILLKNIKRSNNPSWHTSNSIVLKGNVSIWPPNTCTRMLIAALFL